MNRAAILNAFSPARELEDPSRFAGRKDQVRELTDALRMDGSVLVIYGDRGLGKSSTAIQLQLIALGDTALLSELGAGHLTLEPAETFLTLYVVCTERVRSLEDLQRLILHRLQAIELDDAGREILMDRTTKRKISLKYFEHENTNHYQQRAGRIREEALSAEEQLHRELTLLANAFEQPVLIIIDELDRAQNLNGLGQYLKSISSPQVKFLLVGIAQSLTELVVDHTSLTRQLYPVQIPPMNAGELADVIDKAMLRVARQGIDLRFAPDARQQLIKLANGFPWFVHAIGQEVLRSASDSGRTVVTRDDVIVATRNLTDNRFAQQFRDDYRRAVRDSSQREIVLRVFAAWPHADIPTSDVYGVCRSLGVGNPAVYRGHLVKSDYGEPLMTTGLQERGLVRFRNQMFKHYVELRPSIYPGVDKQVEEATARW